MRSAMRERLWSGTASIVKVHAPDGTAAVLHTAMTWFDSEVDYH